MPGGGVDSVITGAPGVSPASSNDAERLELDHQHDMAGGDGEVRVVLERLRAVLACELRVGDAG